MSPGYSVICDPRLLRRTTAEFAIPEPSVDMEADIFPAFSRSSGGLVLRQADWNSATALGKGLRVMDSVVPLCLAG
jgi:hypothetical protein